MGINRKHNAIESILIRTQWSRYIDHFLQQITSKTDFPQVFNLNETQFVPFTIQIPRHLVRYVYMLINRSVPNCVYVGEICNLRRRLKEHNSVLGASFTNVPERRPRAVFCFLAGFTDEKERRHCECFWNEMAQTFQSRRISPSTVDCNLIGLMVDQKERSIENGYLRPFD